MSCLDTKSMEFKQCWPDPKRQNVILDPITSEIFVRIQRETSGLPPCTEKIGLSFNTETRKFSSHRKNDLNPGGVPASRI